MTLLADLPVQRKLRFAMLLTSSLALLVACSVFLTFEYLGYRRNLMQTVATLAQIVADNSTASLAFSDSTAARQILQALAAEPQVVAAGLYGNDGRPLASYSAGPATIPPEPGAIGMRFVDGQLVVVQAVAEGSRRLGTLTLIASQDFMLARMRRSFWVALAILGLATTVSAILATVLGRTLARPILELDRTAGAVTAGQDYSLRARQYGDDELGRLTAAFNGMLATMQRSVSDLRESEQRFRLLADHAPVLIWLTDQHGRHLWHNQRWLDFTGRTQVTEEGEGWASGLHPEDRDWTLRLFHAASETRKEFQLEYRLRRHDGEYRWMMSRGLPRQGDGQGFAGFIGSSIDVTDFKLAERAVAEARDRAIAASRAKDNFLAALSHELRTPLTPVLLLASEEAHNPRLPPEVRHDFEMISKNVALEARLIDDLLDLTRITRGKLVLDHRPADAHAILQDALNTVELDFRERRIDLKVTMAAPRHRLHGDPVRLQQVFWNVLKNAAKFTPLGGWVRVETHVADRNRLLVRISDSGIGLTAGELKRIFEAFSQGEHADTPAGHQFGGLGLGLAISERLVQLHGGAIRASSGGRGKGATFEIELPLDGGAGESNSQPSAYPFAENEPASAASKPA
ncbi:MAG TPA: ATP-binding protein [Lacunisphaera sp.]|nr:ATP-binding protein [Lacunisphaera sp.]